MKKIILPIVILVAFVGVGLLAYTASQHYDNYVSAKRAEAASAEAKAEADRNAVLTVLKTENANLKKDNEFLRANCLKGATAFSKLSLTNQKAIGAIDCGE